MTVRMGLVNSSKSPRQDFAGGDDRGSVVAQDVPESEWQALMESPPGGTPRETREELQERSELLAQQIWPIVDRVCQFDWERAIVMAICQGIPLRKIERHMRSLQESGEIEKDAPVAKSAVHRHWSRLRQVLAEELSGFVS